MKIANRLARAAAPDYPENNSCSSLGADEGLESAIPDRQRCETTTLEPPWLGDFFAWRRKRWHNPAHWFDRL